MTIATFDQQQRTLRLLRQTPGWLRLEALNPDLDAEMAEAVLASAGAFAEAQIAPLDKIGDTQGCELTDQGVKVPPAYHAAYRAFSEAGWIGLDLPAALGGSGLPIALQTAVAPLFERACIAFSMATGASRSAAALLAETAPSEIAEDWVPALIVGARAATICISEPEAGSDVGRIRTRATREGDIWRLSGQKCWISFGEHDLTESIGHCILARTSDAPGTRGLSLFLCPSVWNGKPNGVKCLRIEDKMGLHGSPTCVLEFDGSRGLLLGQLERGLPALFNMIELMRLQTGCQGLGAASKACDIAEQYALERRQGGAPEAPPIPIAQHPDIQRRLIVMRAQTEVLRAATLDLACRMDIARSGPEAEERKAAAALAAFLLPLVKNFGAETGFDVTNQGILVLGGAGYTRDWPLEQTVRDIRVAAIYEGTTGIQALDFLERRLVREQSGFAQFVALAKAEGIDTSRFAETAEMLVACQDSARRQRAADSWFRMGWLMVTAWLAPRLDPIEAEAAMLAWPMRIAVHAEEIRVALTGGPSGFVDAANGKDKT